MSRRAAQELDHYADALADLAPLGYASSVHVSDEERHVSSVHVSERPPYVPVHAMPDEVAKLRSHLEAGGYAFAPKAPPPLARCNHACRRGARRPATWQPTPMPPRGSPHPRRHVAGTVDQS